MSDDARFMGAKLSRAERRARQAAVDEALVGAASRAARDVAMAEPAGPSPAAWHRLMRDRAQGPRSLPRAVTWAAVGVVTCASVLVTVQIGGHLRSSPLTYDVQGGVLHAGGQVEAGGAGSEGTAVRFSDGTEIVLEPAGRLAVNTLGPHGARLRLQAGQAHFRVMHLPHAAWAVEAGPYLIDVTGTEFDVRWSESEQMVEVKMRSGSVRVSGPLLSERVVLGKGQHLLARLGAGDVRIDDGRLAAAPLPTRGDAVPSPPAAPELTPPPAALPLAQAPAAPLTPAARDVGPGPRARTRVRRLALGAPALRQAPGNEAADRAAAVPAGEPMAQLGPPIFVPPVAGPPRWIERNWTGQVAAGDARAVVADAERVGLDVAMHEADGADLAALADAARYTRRPELAERALLAMRHRFSGSARARASAFLLGRMADDRGDARAGLTWYRTYLGESAAGPYAAEALGREMLIVERLQGREASLPIARDYLGRFPNGTYLLQARALIDNR